MGLAFLMTGINQNNFPASSVSQINPTPPSTPLPGPDPAFPHLFQKFLKERIPRAIPTCCLECQLSLSPHSISWGAPKVQRTWNVGPGRDLEFGTRGLRCPGGILFQRLPLVPLCQHRTNSQGLAGFWEYFLWSQRNSSPKLIPEL